MARVGVLVGPQYEDVEYDKPADALMRRGDSLVHIGAEKGSVKGKNGESEVNIDTTVNETSVDDYDALFIPGGFSPDNLRKDENVVKFVSDFVDSGKPMFLICHAPQLLLSAEKIRGRRLTAWTTVQKDLELAGAEVVDEPVVEDGNILTSRNPDDIPAFIDAMTKRLESDGKNNS